MGQFEWRRSMERWWRPLAAGAIALTLGLGQAHAGAIENAHEGGQGADKERGTLVSERFGGEPRARALASATSNELSNVDAGLTEARPEAALPQAGAPKVSAPEATVDVNLEEEDDARSWTRTTTRTVLTARGIIRSVTRSWSYAMDEDGNKAVARAVAKARAPNDVAAVENGAGRVVAKTSVDVTGNGAASADAGGSIGIRDGRVDVSTWGRTTAEVF
jgi:hypothetical protein